MKKNLSRGYNLYASCSSMLVAIETVFQTIINKSSSGIFRGGGILCNC